MRYPLALALTLAASLAWAVPCVTTLPSVTTSTVTTTTAEATTTSTTSSTSTSSTTTTSTSTSVTTTTSTSTSTLASTSSTSSSTSSSTTTSTSTSSSTTTTLVDALWFPSTNLPNDSRSNAWPGTTNVMRCARFVPRRTATSLTKMAWGKVHFSTFDCGIAIYNAAGTATIVTTGAISCPSTGSVQTATGLSAFSLTAGTPYVACWCANSTDGFYRAAGTLGESPTWAQNAISNAFVVATGTATKSGAGCTVGAPPTDFDTFTLDNSFNAIALYLSKE